MKNFFTYFLIASISFFTACKKDNGAGNGVTGLIDNTKLAPDGFNFATTQEVNLNITLKDNTDNPISGVVLSIYAVGATDAQNALFKAVSDKSGNITGKITVPSTYTKLILDPAYVGLSRYMTAKINGTSITATIGGRTGYSGDIVADAFNNNPIVNKTFGNKQTNGATSTDIVFPSQANQNNPYTTPDGLPTYLEATNDVVNGSLLSYCNASLQEGVSVPATHPAFVATNAVRTLNITTTTDVYVTFISEGANYQNTLAYYTYPTNHPPTQVSGGTNSNGIDKGVIIFPNSSANGSGGSLIAGNKVKLGNFTAGTSIAFVLLQNGWTGNGISFNNYYFFSQDEFNPETQSTSNKRHVVNLYDDVHKLFVIGIEDQVRDNGGSDNDFNDVMFYATSTVANAISTTGVAIIDKGGDSDGDGVLDNLDAFPNDPTRAYITYFPSATTYATVAFEDNFPAKGDYDMNDLVMNYRYTFNSNASNQVVDMKAEFVPLAAGASFRNGFGVQLPIPAGSVASVTGQKTIGNIITFAANGVEAGQTNAVIIPFDNTDAVINNPGGGFFVNTLLSKDKVTPTVQTINIAFTSPIAISTLSPSAFNPFLISNQRRGYEIHLPGYLPTSKANLALFGTIDDNSSVSGNRYYLSKDNWPWAISFTGTFNYPIETVNVTTAYPHFAAWAASSGSSFTDWYSNITSGYRNTTSIYNK